MIPLNKKFEFIFLNLCWILLPGCSSLNSTFDCSLSPGASCQSLDEVNDQINRGVLPKVNSNKVLNNKEILKISSDISVNSSTNFKSHPIRSSEVVRRIWIAPYEDIFHNYHSDNFIYTVVQRPIWVNYVS